jgi:hypothetical protein
MAGIIAIAATGQVQSGDTSADNNASGFLTAEQIALATTPTGSSYSWGLSRPQGSTARADLNSLTDATPVFTPDVAGVYCITCDVDGTPYTLRLSVTQLAVSHPLEALRFSPVTDAQVEAPTLGAAMYYSSDQGRLVTKLTDDTVVITPYVLRFADVAVTAFTIDSTFQTAVSVPGMVPSQNANGTIRAQSVGAPLVLITTRPDEDELILVFGVLGSVNWVGGTVDVSVEILPPDVS